MLYSRNYLIFPDIAVKSQKAVIYCKRSNTVIYRVY